MKASSTLAAVLAEVSMKTRPCSLAKASPSSLFTSRRASKSLSIDNQNRMKSIARPFVAYEHDHHVTVAVLPRILQPCGLCGKELKPRVMKSQWISHQVVESVSPGDVVDKQSPCCSSAWENLVIDQWLRIEFDGKSHVPVVRPCDRPKCFLARLKQNCLKLQSSF